MDNKGRYIISIIESNSVKNICLNDFNKSKISFGRSKSNDIVISSPIISSCHGYFNLGADGVEVIDNDSTNGIYIFVTFLSFNNTFN